MGTHIVENVEHSCVVENGYTYSRKCVLHVEKWGAGVETQKYVRETLGDGVEYHLMKPTPRR